jgi:hypothetical protein
VSASAVLNASPFFVVTATWSLRSLPRVSAKRMSPIGASRAGAGSGILASCEDD